METFVNKLSVTENMHPISNNLQCPRSGRALSCLGARFDCSLNALSLRFPNDSHAMQSNKSPRRCCSREKVLGQLHIEFGGQTKNMQVFFHSARAALSARPGSATDHGGRRWQGRTVGSDTEHNHDGQAAQHLRLAPAPSLPQPGADSLPSASFSHSHGDSDVPVTAAAHRLR